MNDTDYEPKYQKILPPGLLGDHGNSYQKMPRFNDMRWSVYCSTTSNDFTASMAASMSNQLLHKRYE